jgi:hypothetical protein
VRSLTSSNNPLTIEHAKVLVANMISSAEETEPGPDRALVAIPPRPVEPPGLRRGMVFYLVSVGLVATATFGASLGIGLYLLVHPPEGNAAERASTFDDRPNRAAPTPGEADRPRTAAAIEFFAAVTEAPAQDRTNKAPAPTPIALSSGDLLPSPPASISEPKVLPKDVVRKSARSEGRGGEGTLGTLQEAGHLAVQDTTPDANLTPAKGERSNNAYPDQEQHSVPGGQPGERAEETSSPTQVVEGIVTDVPNVATWIVGGRTTRLFGITPGPPKLLASLVNWVRAKGPVECVPQAGIPLYRCFTATGEDIVEAALLAGVGRAGERATVAYETAESDARRLGKGLWARR